MSGRFPLLTDENVPGPLIGALQIAHRWLRAGKPFRMVWWKQAPYQHVRPRAFVDAFDALAAQADDPFRYPICYLKPQA